MTTDTRPKEAVVSTGGFTVGGMAKGSGMIHPDLATMLAVVTTDYPLEPGEAIEFLRPAVEAQLQRDLGRRRAVDERRRDPARERRERRARATTTRSRRRWRRCAPTSRGRSSPTARASPCSPRSPSPARPTTARRRRSRAGSRPRRSSRPRSSATTRTGAACSMAAGSAPWNGGYADDRRRPRHASATTARSSSSAARRSTSSPTSPARAARSSSTSASATGSASYLTSDLSYDYVRINADYRIVSRIVVKVGGAVASRARRRRCSSSRATTRSASCTARGRRSALEMERAGIPVEFVGGRRVTTEAGIADRARLARGRQRRARAPRSASAPSRSSATRSASEATQVPELGLVGDPIAVASPPMLVTRSRRGPDPGRRAARAPGR